MYAQDPSCGQCTRPSDNKHFDCPPRMSDGRLFTDWRPRCDIQLEHQSPMTGTHDYRQFMINNAQSIVDSQRQSAFKRAFCGPCVRPYAIGTMVPEKDAFVCDKINCKRVGAGPGQACAGIGTGRSYGSLPCNKRAEQEFLAGQIRLQAQSAASCGRCSTPAPPFGNHCPSSD
jgi:hypothetical protein